MVEFSEENVLHVPPDCNTFHLMIEMMARSNAVEEADKYLELLKASPILETRHGKIFSCYLTTISAWCETRTSAATARAEVLVDELIELVRSGKIPTPSQSERARLVSIVHKSSVSSATVKGVKVVGGVK